MRRELSKARVALRESEERYRQIVESTSEGIVKVDPAGVIVFSNQRFGEMMGYALDEMLGQSILYFMSSEGKSIAGEARKRRMQGVKDSIEVTFLHKDGKEVAVSMAGAPILDDDGGYLGSLSVVRDVTEQKHLMAKLMVSDRMASVGTLAAGMAHEINNPLAVVIANLNIIASILKERGGHAPAPILEVGLWEGIKEPLDDALEAADRVRIIVRDLKIFSRIPDEELLSPVNVQLSIESALRMAWNEIRHRARLIRDYSHVPMVKANDAHLCQVFLNLIVNAAQALPENQLENNEIRLSTRLEGDRVIVEVRDTGEGIPPKIIGRVFDAFFTTKSVGTGTGLGLAISHSIVTGIGGELTVKSQVGQGTTFKVSLPIASGEQEPAATDLPQATAPSALRGRILVVDDEELILRILKRILSEHTIVTAITGKEALALCAAGEKFDVILCDLMMPNLSGMDVYRELLFLAPDQAEKMIFMTGGAFTPTAQEFLAQINREFIDKPFRPDDLRAVVQRLLR